ncbi:MAG: hypothetical protein JST86_15845 [Bacteroidetes bacterium]|nr:hypothetical protein [Bacteroidota bacterium]
MLSLSKYYKRSAILPFGVVFISGIILNLTHDGSRYQSEWFTDDGFVFSVGLTILLSIFISLLSLTLLLNQLASVRKNPILSMVCWMLLPTIVCALVIYEEILNFTGQSDFHEKYEGNRLLDGYILSVGILHFSACFLVGFIIENT